MCASNILDQMLGSNQVSDTPAGCIKCLTGGSHGQSALVELWRQGRDSSEGNVIETVVDFVGKNDKVMLNTELSNTFEFSLREDLANRVVTVTVSNLLGVVYQMPLTGSSAPGNKVRFCQKHIYL